MTDPYPVKLKEWGQGFEPGSQGFVLGRILANLFEEFFVLPAVFLGAGP